MQPIITLRHAVAIPVGHRVDVILVTKRFLGMGSTRVVLRDQHTGVWYGDENLLESTNESTVNSKASTIHWPQLRADVTVTERFSATVTACVVALDNETTERRHVTTLHLERDG